MVTHKKWKFRTLTHYRKTWKSLFEKLNKRKVKMNLKLDKDLAWILKSHNLKVDDLREYIMNDFNTPQYLKKMVEKLKKLKHSIKNLDREWQIAGKMRESKNSSAIYYEMKERQGEYRALKQTYNILVPQKVKKVKGCKAPDTGDLM